MALPTPTLVIVVVVSSLLGIVLSGILGALIYQGYTRRRSRRKQRKDLEAATVQPATLQLTRRKTLQKGYRREIPRIRSSRVVIQSGKQYHSSWTVPLTEGTDSVYSVQHRSREDVINPLAVHDPRKSDWSSHGHSFENIWPDGAEDDATTRMRLSMDEALQRRNSQLDNPSVLEQEISIFDPGYIPPLRPNRQVSPKVSTIEPLNIPPKAHRKNPSSQSHVSIHSRGPSGGSGKRRFQPSWLGTRRNGHPEKMRSLETMEPKVLVRSNRDSAIDIASPPITTSGLQHTQDDRDAIESNFRDYASSGLWLANLIPFGESSSLRDGQVRSNGFPGNVQRRPGTFPSPSQMLQPGAHAPNPYEIEFSIATPMTIRSVSARPLGLPLSHSSPDLSTLPSMSQPQSSRNSYDGGFQYNKRFMHSATSLKSPMRTMSPLNETSEPPSSVDERSASAAVSFGESSSSSGASNSTIRERYYLSNEGVSPRSITPSEFPVISSQSQCKQKERASSPSCSIRSLDSEAPSVLTLSNLAGLAPRPRQKDEMFSPIREEHALPDSPRSDSSDMLEEFDEDGSGAVTPRALWSPSALTNTPDAYPFPSPATILAGSSSYSPSLLARPAPEPPKMTVISDVFGLGHGPASSRSSIGVSELESSIKEIEKKLQWAKESRSRQTDMSHTSGQSSAPLASSSHPVLEPLVLNATSSYEPIRIVGPEYNQAQDDDMNKVSNDPSLEGRPARNSSERRRRDSLMLL
jgi:hypothetical protein